MSAAAPNPYAAERATLNALLWSGSAARYGPPASLVGEHVGHG